MSSSRRAFLRTTIKSAPAVALAPAWVGQRRRKRGLTFVPDPHPLTPALSFAMAVDESGDPFQTLTVSSDGIVIAADEVKRPFAVSTRWFVEGFGYIWLEADNGGRFYGTEDLVEGRTLSLNHEFAQTRVSRNAARILEARRQGVTPSTETAHLQGLAEELLSQARTEADAGRSVDLANRSLLYALLAGERFELDWAESSLRRPRDGHFYFGCETRQYVWAKNETFMERFQELFNYATVTHYVWDSWYEIFEPKRGEHRWGIKDNIVDWLTDQNIAIEGRPLFWFHPVVTPDWLAQMNFDQLKSYVVEHTNELVGHYGDRVLHWEVINEYHDWANIHNHSPEQITEIVRLACDQTHAVNPRVNRIINNCCPYGNYAAYGHAAHGEAPRELRTPRKFVSDIVEAGVDFETVGVQMYFPQRDLADIVRQIERFAVFGKPVFITEMGATSGPTRLDVMKGGEIPGAPYEWHRPWDEDLQADWLEAMYKVFYSKPYIEGISWYDFADFRTFIPNGGLIREDASIKQSYTRLKSLLGRWERLPQG